MVYPPGRAPLAILIMAVVSGVLLLVPPGKQSDAQLRAAEYSKAHGKPAQVINAGHSPTITIRHTRR